MPRLPNETIERIKQNVSLLDVVTRQRSQRSPKITKITKDPKDHKDHKDPKITKITKIKDQRVRFFENALRSGFVFRYGEKFCPVSQY